jgi:hypothetical protein
MTVTWNGASVLAKVRAAAAAGVGSGTEIYREEATSLMLNSPRTGRAYKRRGVTHVASGAGEPPAPDTAYLMRTIETINDEKNLKSTVNFGAVYAKRMEYGFVGTDSLGRTYDQAPRPFARPAMENKRAEIANTIATAIADALK